MDFELTEELVRKFSDGIYSQNQYGLGSTLSRVTGLSNLRKANTAHGFKKITKALNKSNLKDKNITELTDGVKKLVLKTPMTAKEATKKLGRKRNWELAKAGMKIGAIGYGSKLAYDKYKKRKAHNEYEEYFNQNQYGLISRVTGLSNLSKAVNAGKALKTVEKGSEAAKHIANSRKFELLKAGAKMGGVAYGGKMLRDKYQDSRMRSYSNRDDSYFNQGQYGFMDSVMDVAKEIGRKIRSKFEPSSPSEIKTIKNDISKMTTRMNIKPDDLLLATQGVGPVAAMAKTNPKVAEIVSETSELLQEYPTEQVKQQAFITVEGGFWDSIKSLFMTFSLIYFAVKYRALIKKLLITITNVI